MRKLIMFAVIGVLAVGGVALYSGALGKKPAAAGGVNGAEGRGGPGARGNFGRPPMTVELTSPSRAHVAQQITVVGNLIGDATVAVVPKTAGRLDAVFVRLGDRVGRGQRIGKIEDREILQQVKQAEAASEVGQATIRQRQADLKFAQTNLDRSRSLFDRQLLPRQTLDDADARFQAAEAQLDLARAQVTQNGARLEELRISLANTLIVSPVDGFVARRAADPGAYVSPNAPVVDVVDINRVRLVANVIEKDLRRVQQGAPARVEVDAFPGEAFGGRIARLAPVLDPQTRTAEIEVEIVNADFRLKPGMYARVSVTTEERQNALVVPRNAVVDLDGKRGVFLAKDQVVQFRPIEIGIEEPVNVEVLSGVGEADKVVTTGAGALRDGDRILLAARPGEQTDTAGGSAPRQSMPRGRPAGAGSEQRAPTASPAGRAPGASRNPGL